MDRLEQLEMAQRHVAEGEIHLSRQKALIAELDRDGHDTADARRSLRRCSRRSGFTWRTATAS